MAFGKRTTPTQPGAPQPATQAEPRTEDANAFPWSSDPASTGCNFAFGHLVRNLPARFAIDGRIHAETYVAGAGAIAGFAAQQALFATMTPTMGVNINVVELKSGEKFWFGDNLNFTLVPNGHNDREKLWPLAAGTAVGAGLAMDKVPSLEDMFRRVTSSLGGPDAGWPSTPGHKPQMPTLFLLQLAWPLAEACLTGSISEAIPQHLKLAPKRWWPCITAYAAANAIRDVKQVLPPADALVIVMEAAIFASKVSEETARRKPTAPA